MKKPDAVIKTEQMKQAERQRVGVKNVKLTFDNGKTVEHTLLDELPSIRNGDLPDCINPAMNEGFTKLKVNPDFAPSFETPVEVVPEPAEWIKQLNNHGEFLIGDETLRRAVLPFYSEKNPITHSWQHILDAFEIVMQRDKAVIEALSALLSDLEMRSVKGVVDCSDGVYTEARDALAKVSRT